MQKNKVITPITAAVRLGASPSCAGVRGGACRVPAIESKGDSMEVDALDKVKGKGRGERRETTSKGKGLRTSYVVSAENQDIDVPTTRRCRNASRSPHCPRCTTLAYSDGVSQSVHRAFTTPTTDNHHPRCHVQVIQHLTTSLHLSLSPWEIGTAH